MYVQTTHADRTVVPISANICSLHRQNQLISYEFHMVFFMRISLEFIFTLNSGGKIYVKFT